MVRYGIAIRPDAPQHVFVGTSCGLAITHNSGATWTFVNPFAGPFSSGRSHVWDIVVQPGGSRGEGIVDVCGLQGHARSVDGGDTWTRNMLPYPRYTTGRCSIAVSPDEPYVLFITDDITDPLDESVDPFPPNLHHVYESDDAGATWVSLGSPYPALVDNPPVPRATKRLTFVVTNKRSLSDGVRRFDLWYGEGGLWRAPCATPASPAPAPAPAGTNATTARCPMAQATDGVLLWKGPPQWLHPVLPHYAGQGPILEHIGAHGDSGDLIFDPTMPVDACPLLYASDGGIFINDTSLFNIGGCHNPTEFRQPAKAPHALWLWGMAGANLANGAVAIHFGVQDNGSWATADARTMPTWFDGPTAELVLARLG